MAGPSHPVSAIRDEHAIMDTRTPSPVQRAISAETNGSSASDPDYKPDLSAEVAMLSTKLVNAINYQTNLDDSLQQSRHELEQSRQRCSALEEENRHHEELVKKGELVKRSETDKIIVRLRSEVANEKAAREAAEKAKKQTEGELENLTSALFEEANSMVAAARKDTEAVEKRNAQLRSQIQDTEMLLASQQEQLQDLKSTMERLQAQTPSGADPSVPSTPITTNTAVFDALQVSPNGSTLPDVAPEHPLHFSQLISPVLKSDTSAYTDFQDLLLLAKRLGAHSRQNSNNATPSLSSTGQTTSAGTISASPNLPGSFSFAGNSSPNASAASSNIPPLKESKFYKRVLTEDIEPTLRLDLAPGLSFLSRRTVLGSLLQGTLAVEPYPQNKHYFACTLCGESRRNEPYQRKYRFRTSEDDSVSKPLCDYCVARLRATCDFVGFLRMVRDGHWRCDTEDDMKSGWEESVRLRERMFWARLGGGVVPCLQMQKGVPASPSSAAGMKSSRPSLESIPEGQNSKSSEPADEPDVFDGDQKQAERPKSSVGQAIVGMSSAAAVVVTPEMQPQQTEEDEPEPLPSPEKLHVEEEDAEAAADPATPFEDANEEPELPSGDDQASADASAAQREARKSHDEKTPESPSGSKEDNDSKSELADELEDEAEAASSVPTQSEQSEESAISSARNSLHVPSSNGQAGETTPRSSLNVDRPAQHERKNSSVLARVRAMEASKN